VIKNIAGFDAAIRAVCPIDGVGADGHIFFQAAATPTQIAAANTAAAAFVDAAPQMVLVSDARAAMTPAEYAAVMQLANAQLATNPAIHQTLTALKAIDVSKAPVQAIIQALVTGGALSAPRAALLFAAPPAVAPAVVAPTPLPTSNV
jgi:cysteine synthase